MASKNPDIDVYVKLTKGRNVQYDVAPSTTIEALVGMVAKDEAVAANQVRLKYQGKVLAVTKTVKEYGVRAETILKAELLVPKSITLVLKLPDDAMDEITLSNLDTTKTLFGVIGERTGFPTTTIDATCKGVKIITNATRLMDAGIVHNSEINVKRRAEEKTSAKKEASQTDETMAEDEKEAVLSSFQSNGRQVEVVFSFDTTGSMYSYLTQVRTKLRECCTRLLQDIPTIRLGLMAHGDYCDENSHYVIRSVDLTDDVDRLTNFANDVPETGGGDCPECYEWVLRKAQHLDWSEDSAKALVVIGDDCPHPPSYTDQNIRWRDEVDVLKGMGVKVYGVQAGSGQSATHFYSEIADMTGGRHLKLNHFDIITDMFLAVCYQEGNEELLEDFQQEMQDAGRMTEQARAMFVDLKKTDDDKEEKDKGPSKRSKRVRDAWWDDTLDKTTTPSYMYDAQTDKWRAYTRTTTVHSPSTPEETPERFTVTRPLRSKKKIGCSVM